MSRSLGFSYEVSLPGEFGQAYLATFADLGVRRVTAASVFLLVAQSAEAIPEIAAMLQARGLTILGIRRVSTPGNDFSAERTARSRDHTPALVTDNGPCLLTARSRTGALHGAPSLAASRRPPTCAAARPAPTGSPG